MENPIQQDTLPNQSLGHASFSKPTNWTTMMSLILLGIAILSVLVYAYVQAGNKKRTNQQSFVEQQTNNLTQTVIEPTTVPAVLSPIDTIQGVKFSGIITETNNGCWADGICSIRVDDRWIVVEFGGLRPTSHKSEPRGSLIGISFGQETNTYIGKKVEVYVKRSKGENFTIYGDERYYVKLLD